MHVSPASFALCSSVVYKSKFPKVAENLTSFGLCLACWQSGVTAFFCPNVCWEAGSLLADVAFQGLLVPWDWWYCQLPWPWWGTSKSQSWVQVQKSLFGMHICTTWHQEIIMAHNFIDCGIHYSLSVHVQMRTKLTMWTGPVKTGPARPLAAAMDWLSQSECNNCISALLGVYMFYICYWSWQGVHMIPQSIN